MKKVALSLYIWLILGGWGANFLQAQIPTQDPWTGKPLPTPQVPSVPRPESEPRPSPNHEDPSPSLDPRPSLNHEETKHEGDNPRPPHPPGIYEPVPQKPQPHSERSLADMPLQSALDRLGRERRRLQRQFESCERQLMTYLRDSAQTTSWAERKRLSKNISEARSCVEKYRTYLRDLDKKIYRYKFYTNIAPNKGSSKLSDAYVAIQRALEVERAQMLELLQDIKRQNQEIVQLAESADRSFQDFKRELIGSVAQVTLGLAEVRRQIEKRKTELLRSDLTSNGKESIKNVREVEYRLEQISIRYEKIKEGIELMEQTVKAIKGTRIAADLFLDIQRMLESGVLSEEEAKQLEKDIKEALDFIRDWAEGQTLETVLKYASSYRGLVGTIAKRWPAIQGLMAVAKMGIRVVEIQDITENQREAYYASLQSMMKIEYIRRERIEPLMRRLKECEEDLKERGN